MVQPAVSKTVDDILQITIPALRRQINPDKIQVLFGQHVLKRPFNPTLSNTIFSSSIGVTFIPKKINSLHELFNTIQDDGEAEKFKNEVLSRIDRLLRPPVATPAPQTVVMNIGNTSARITPVVNTETFAPVIIVQSPPSSSHARSAQTQIHNLSHNAHFELPAHSKNCIIEAKNWCWIDIGEHCENITINVGKESQIIVSSNCSGITITTTGKCPYKISEHCNDITINGIKWDKSQPSQGLTNVV